MYILVSYMKPSQAASPIEKIQGDRDHPALPAAAYLSRLTTQVSKKGMETVLRNVAEILSGQRDWTKIDWRGLNAAVVDAVMAKVKGSPATRNKTLSALKGVARASYRLNLMSGEDLAKVRDIEGDKGSRVIRGRDATQGEIASLMRVCCEDTSPSGARDAALLAFVASTGARRSEIVSLSVDDLIEREDQAFTVRLVGKGNKERLLYLHNGAADALNKWLEIRGEDKGALFCRINKGGILYPRDFVTTTALNNTLKKRMGEAGVSNLSWHDFRRTVAGNLLDAGADVSTVAAVLGHANIATTQRYDRRGERAKVSALQLLTVPYFR